MDLVKTYTKEYLKEIISQHVVNVTFFKKNGERRDMKCTLLSSVIPESPKVEPVLTEDGIIPPKKVRVESPDTLSVFDLDKNGWRSFTVESVTNMEIIDDSV